MYAQHADHAHMRDVDRCHLPEDVKDVLFSSRLCFSAPLCAWQLPVRTNPIEGYRRHQQILIPIPHRLLLMVFGLRERLRCCMIIRNQRGHWQRQ